LHVGIDIQDIIACGTFCDDRLRGFGVARGRISRFPTDLRRRPYNTLALYRASVCCFSCPRPYVIILHSYGAIEPVCAESAVKLH